MHRLRPYAGALTASAVAGASWWLIGAPVAEAVLVAAVACLTGCVVNWWLQGAPTTPPSPSHQSTPQPLTDADMQAAAQAARLQAVGQLAGGIAHDFNNLLTAISGFSELLAQRHRPGDRSFGDAMQIRQNVNRAANLVRQLLAFSRQQTLTPRIIDVNDVLADVGDLLRRLVGSGIDVRIDYGRDIGMVLVDQGQLEQVIVNLAVNARDAMPGGGVLSISVAPMRLLAPLPQQGEPLPAGEYVSLTVTDTGTGIAAEHLPRLFEPFFSTKAPGAGTGLGLATVYGIVRQTGGGLQVQSTLGEGAAFTIYLPVVQAGPSPPPPAPSPPMRRPPTDLTGSGRILLVEDEDSIRMIGARTLNARGFTVLEACDGEDALAVLADHGAVDLVVTDVVMPIMDGPTLIAQLLQQTPYLKVIYTSGYAEDTFREEIARTPGARFLAKPFTLQQLAQIVKEELKDIR